MRRRAKPGGAAGAKAGGRDGAISALRVSILAGIVYDWAVAVLIFARPPAVLGLLGIDPPPDPFHFGFAGLCLVVLPIFYWLPWSDPVRYSGVVAAMIAARLAGFVYLTGYGGALHVPQAFLAFGVVDLLFAATHAILARRAGLPGRG